MNNRLLDCLKKAKGCMDGGEYSEALKVLESALVCASEPWLETEIYFQAAICKCEMEDYAGAVENLETALSLAGNATYEEKKHIYGLLLSAYMGKPDYIKLAELCKMLIGIEEEDKTSLALSMILAYGKAKKWHDLARFFDDFPDIDLDDEALLQKITCLMRVGRYEEAFQAADKYIGKSGEDHKICCMLMRLFCNTGDGARGFEYYKKAISLCDDPNWRLEAGGLLLFEDLYQNAVSNTEFPEIIRDMRRSTEKLQTNTVFANALKPFKKIKIGYLSADFRQHPVGYFLLPVMVSTVTSHCFNYCFNLTQHDDNRDPVTTQFKSLAHRWEEVYERPDSYIEQLFLTNSIDIAFDMMCYTDDNRMQLYAKRLAPVQISWIGLPVTTGVAAMDYVITDKDVDPPGSEKYYTEKLLYMPECFLCTTLTGNPHAVPPAFTRNGYITFACFHNTLKITDKTLHMWRGILDKSRDSRLKIMGYHYAGEKALERLDQRLRKTGFPMERVSVLPHCDIKNYFAAYNDVDIMLDTYPFSGATTTFDALRMGRPIITLVGERHVSRVSYSLLKHVGLEDLAAFSEDEYVEKAVTLAGDHERLSKINAELPRQVENSPLTNQPAFRENFEKLIRDVWIDHCFTNRAEECDYRADSPQELLDQVVNATTHIKRKLDAGEAVDDVLAAEYYRVQKAFCEKLSLVTKNEEFVREYEKLVVMIGRGLGEKDLGPAILTARQHLSTFYKVDVSSKRSRVCFPISSSTGQ
jgi:predicted O-linked N-acetylglucosamine transferase (SPINDLY family)